MSNIMMRRRRRKVGGSHVEGLSIRYLTAHCTKNQCTMQCTMQHYAMCYATQLNVLR